MVSAGAFGRRTRQRWWQRAAQPVRLAPRRAHPSPPTHLLRTHTHRLLSPPFPPGRYIVHVSVAGATLAALLTIGLRFGVALVRVAQQHCVWKRRRWLLARGALVMLCTQARRAGAEARVVHRSRARGGGTAWLRGCCHRHSAHSIPVHAHLACPPHLQALSVACWLASNAYVLARQCAW